MNLSERPLKEFPIVWRIKAVLSSVTVSGVDQGTGSCLLIPLSSEVKTGLTCLVVGVFKSLSFIKEGATKAHMLQEHFLLPQLESSGTLGLTA